jgi:hypothetical protein
MAGIRWTEEEYLEWLKTKAPSSNLSPSVPSPNLERHTVNAAKAKDETKEVHSRIRITVHHRSRRLADTTGRSHKWAVDGLVRGGILEDDSPKYVGKIEETYEKGKDQTVITLWKMED